MKKLNILFLLLIILGSGCSLDEVPKDAPNAKQVFSSENGLEKYINSFYPMIPSASDITHAVDISDYTSKKAIDDLLRVGRVNDRTVDRWDWDDLRNINYFLKNNKSSNISVEVRDNYNGIARFFRAWFYFKKVKKYGKVPWIAKPLSINSDQLMAPRDSRSEVMDSVLADVDFAIEHISDENESSRTKITRDVALALKSRICLFEGTYRKYHGELGLESSSQEWLEECVKASEELMDQGTYNVYNGSGVDHSYKELFTSDKPVSSSVILADVYSTELGRQHDANWWYTSASYGNGISFVRPFINTFLMRDGTPFTDKPDYKTMVFTEEVKNRDARLEQSIRMPDYKMKSSSGEDVITPPNFSYTFSGYQPIKWCIPDKHYNDRDYNTNSIPIFRYGEVLLNYAEAKAELGNITDGDWNKTVGELRRRAGITNGTTSLPTKIDSYLQATYFPDISDPTILEIRRCRGIELSLEGFRFDDIRRWKRGELLEMQWTGIYIPKANEYMDITGDGEPDVYFYTDDEPDNRKEGVQYVNVGTNDWNLTDGSSGYLIRLPNIERVWEDKKYLYPLNRKDLQKNPNLDQNPGW